MDTLELPKKVETVPSNKYGKFQWDDPLLLENQLTDEERAIPRHRTRLLPGKADAAHPDGKP